MKPFEQKSRETEETGGGRDIHRDISVVPTELKEDLAKRETESPLDTS
jgi:hypothetical protein